MTMNATPPTVPRLASIGAALVGFFAIAASGVTLLGWILGMPELTGWLGDDIHMFANTALMAIGCGTALLLEPQAGTWKSHAIRLLGLLTAALACATLFQHITGIDLGIDNMVAEHRWGARAATVPGRPGPPASLSFALLGAALILSTFGTRWRAFAAALTVSVAVVASVNLTGFLFGADQLYGVARYTGIALQSAAIILALALGLLVRLSDHNPMRTFFDPGGAGLLIRRALPAALLLPAVLGWLQLIGQQIGWFDMKFGMALLTTTVTLAFCGLLGWCAALIAAHEGALRRNETALRQEIDRRSRMEKALERRAHEQAALYVLVDRLHRSTSRQDLFDAALDCIHAALGCDRASILLFDANGTMRFEAWRGLSDTYRAAAAGHSPWKATDAAAVPLCIEDVEGLDAPESLKNAIRAEGIRALAFVPLVAGGKLIGKFMIYHDQPRAFPAEEREYAVAVARQLSFGLRRREAEDALRGSEEMRRSITDHSQDIIFVKDRDCRILFMNPAGLRMSGLAEDQIIGRNDADALPELAEQAARFMAADRRVMESRQSETIEEQVVSATGRIYTLLTTKTPRLDAEGRVIGLIGISRDVTERKRDEERLREAAQRAEEASRAKDDFLAALSHELRTPLTPVLMTAAAMEDDPALDAETRDAFAMISRNIQLEARLIDDLLDLTRIVRGKLSLHPATCDLHLLIVQADEIARSGDSIGKNLAVQLHLDAREHHIQADPTRLQQVLWNLLKNALKFTPEGGTVRLSTTNSRPGRVEIRITDSGIGIAPEVLGSIFQPFDQGHLGSRHRFGGLGLGLAISRAIVEQHDGTLRAESDGPGHGATFVVELATCPAPQPPVTGPCHSQTPSAPSHLVLSGSEQR